MSVFGKTPFTWLTLDKAGNLDGGEKPLKAVEAAMQRENAKDLLILSHGWKNEHRHALNLYRRLWHKTLPHLPASRPFVLAGIAWPAVRYPTDFDLAALEQVVDTRALAGSGGSGPQDLDASQFEELIQAALPDIADQKLRQLAREAAGDPGPTTSAALVDEMLRRLEALTRELDQQEDPEVQADQAALAKAAADDPMKFLHVNTQPLAMQGPDAQALGGGRVGRFFAGPRATIARLINQFTYYPMKIRAGTMGAALAQHLEAQPFLRNVRLHLAGHSFGGRLVTSCAANMKTIRLQSLTLLQAAFSHNGLAAQTPFGAGAFANVISGAHVRGPIAITHTHNDRACTVFYPLASRLSGDRTLALGDRSDPYGAIGANGAQHVETENHADFPAADRHQPLPGKVNNYLADREIIAVKGGPDAHNNVANSATGRLLAAVLMA